VVSTFGIITELGDSKWYLVPTSVIALVVLPLTYWRRSSRPVRLLRWGGWAALFVFAAVALSGIAANIIKFLVGRGRPKMLNGDGLTAFEPFRLNADFHSFPSGHANTAVALAITLAFFFPRLRWMLAAFAALVAASRVIVGTHFVSDAIGGALLAVATTFALRHWCARHRLVFVQMPHGAYRLAREGRILGRLLLSRRFSAR